MTRARSGRAFFGVYTCTEQSKKGKRKQGKEKEKKQKRLEEKSKNSATKQKRKNENEKDKGEGQEGTDLLCRQSRVLCQYSSCVSSHLSILQREKIIDSKEKQCKQRAESERTKK
jgi:hypothetical protein